MDVQKKVILVFLAISLFLVVLTLSLDFPTGLGIYYGNTSATNPEGTIRFKVATMIIVTLISPLDNTIFTIPGTTLNVSLTCTVTNLTPVNVTQVKLYTDISGPFGITQVVNVTGPAPHTVTFNVSNVPLGTYQWNCEGITATGINAFAPANWRFTIRTLLPPSPGGGGGGGWIPPPVIELAEYPLPCIIPPPGLKSWWTFDADLDDFWNISNKGMPAGQPKYVKRKSEYLKNNLAISLDGKNDYVMISPDNTYNNFAEGTIDGWIQYKNNPDYGVIFSYSDIAKSEALAKHLKLRINPAGDIELEYRDGPNYRIVQPDAVFNFKKQAKKWVHFAVTYEDGLYEWFINGVRYGSKTVVSEGTPLFWFNDLADSNTLTGTIGAGIEGGLPIDYFYGAIDEIEIYNRPLTFYEVNAIYARSKCKIKPPVEEKPEIPIIEEKEKVLEETRLYAPKLITPIPWWLLILALLGISAVMFAYYKGIKKKAKKKTSKKSRKKRKRKRKR